MGKFIFEVEKGKTKECKNCPFGVYVAGNNYICGNVKMMYLLDCNKYDFTTLKITKEED